MRRSDNDLLHVAEAELGQLNQDELLRLVVITRDGTHKSPTKQRSAWAELVTKDYDRVRGIVKAFRHSHAPGVRVLPDNVDDVAQDSYIRLLKMAFTFRGTTTPEFRAAMRRCVDYQCRDHCREEMEEDKKRGGSLQEEIKSEEGDGRPKFERQMASDEKLRLEDEEEAERLNEESRRVDEAIAQIDNDRKRRVLEMTRDGCSTQEIMDELGESRDNVYQLRLRAIKLVRRILDGD